MRVTRSKRPAESKHNFFSSYIRKARTLIENIFRIRFAQVWTLHCIISCYVCRLQLWCWDCQGSVAPKLGIIWTRPRSPHNGIHYSCTHVDTGSFMTQILMRHEIIRIYKVFTASVYFLCSGLCTASHCNSCARWKIAARSWCWWCKVKTWDPRPCTWDLYKERKWGNISNIYPLKRQNKSVFCCLCRGNVSNV